MASTTTAQDFYEKNVSVRAISGLSSALSILGSALIILSYLCFRSLRTRARLILVHLALTDMGVGIANLVGIIVNFDQYFPHGDLPANVAQQPNLSIVNLCKTQASVAEYCTLSSVLWTSCLAVYMYLLIVNKNSKQTKMFLWFSYVFCYGMPLLVTVWMLCTERLGYSPYNSSGWCAVVLVKPYYGGSKAGIDVMAAIIGYDMWMILTIVLIAVLYISVFSHVRLQYHQVKENTDSKLFWQAMHNIDYKFILIPVMFIFLRMWTLVLNMLEIYLQIPPEDIVPWAMKALLYLSGVGDSGQGFFNAILFVAFTHSVRKRLFASLCLKVFKRQKIIKTEEENSIYSETRHIFKSSNPVNSKKYNSLPQGQVNSASEQQQQSVTPISEYSPVVSWK